VRICVKANFTTEFAERLSAQQKQHQRSSFVHGVK